MEDQTFKHYETKINIFLSVSKYEHVLRDSKTENKDSNNYQCIISSIAVA